MRAIDADALYEKVQHDEELARNRVLDTESTLPYPNNLNPSYTRYVAQMNERTRLKEMVADAPTVTPEQKRGKWEEKAVSDEKVIDEWQSARCSACGKYHTAPYMYYFNNYNFCPNCGARMTEEDV